MQYFFKFLSLILLFTFIGCSKESLNNMSKLASSQTHARLQKFPELLSLNEKTEGVFQLTSQSTATGVTRNLPSKELLMGIVYPNIGSIKGIDVGVLSIEKSLSKTVKHPINSNEYGVYYENGDNMGDNDVFGKTVNYKLQNADDTPVFKGQIYVPERIKFERPNIGGISYWSRTKGKINWIPDPNNEIGVGVYLTLVNYKTGKSRGDTFLIDDDGSFEASDFLTPQDSQYDEVSITLFRGNGIVENGIDGRKYKLLVYSSCQNDFIFEP
jgi:hypothetical protein